MPFDDEIQHSAGILAASKHAVALTGAGISTPSGIPDFRTPQTGLWERCDPMQVASIQVFCRDPQVFYDWIRPLAEKTAQAQPNPAHLALAEMERAGVIKTVCTQNIDGLHHKAGSVHVLELHGSMRQATCMRCGSNVPSDQLWAQVSEHVEIPHCHRCQGIMKPDIVLYGEDLPTDVLFEAQDEARNCDVMLVVGSSLEVYPAAELPLMAWRHGAQVIIVDRQPTEMDSQATVVVRDDVAIAVPKIAVRLKQLKRMA